MKTNKGNFYSVKFSIKFQTQLGENIFILGNIKELGNWKETKFRLKWSEGHIWKGKIEIPNEVAFFSFKFVCIGEDNLRRWEEGPNRLFDLRKFNTLNSLDDTDNAVYKLDCVWEHFSITFNIYYPLSNETEHLQIIGSPAEIGAWFKNGGLPVKMNLTEPKTIGGTI